MEYKRIVEVRGGRMKKKAMISQLMTGKSKEEIIATREKAVE